MKTPEQLAEECVRDNGSGDDTHEHILREGCLGGYKAAMNSPEKLDSWISVHKRLPEEDTGVLAFINYTVENEPVRRVTSGAFRGGLWLTDNEILAHPLVSHWMPLPTPPEE